MSVLVQHPVPTGRLPLTISTRPTLQQQHTTSQPSTGFVDHIETPLETPATGSSQFNTPIDAQLITPVNNPQVETVLQLFNNMPHSDQELRRFVQQQQLLADLLADIDNTESARKSQDQRRRQHLTMTTLRRALPDRIQLMRHKAGQDTDEHQRLDSFVHAWNTVDSWYDNRNGNIVTEQQPCSGAPTTSFTAKANHASTRTVQASVPCAARARAPSHGAASMVPPASGSVLEGPHSGRATGHEVPIRYEHGGLGPRHVSQGNMPSRPSFPPTHTTNTTHVPSRFCADVFSGATSFTSSYNTTVSSVSVPCASGAPADGSCAAEAFGAQRGGPTMFLHPTSTTMEQPAHLVNTHAGSNNLHQQNVYWNNGPAHTASVNPFAAGNSAATQQPLTNVNPNVITPTPNVERRDTPSRHIYGHKALALPDSRESPAFYDHKVRRLRDSAYWKKKHASIGGVTSTTTSTPSNVTQTNASRPLRGNFGEKINTEAAVPIRNDTGGWSTALPQKAHRATCDAAGFPSSVPMSDPTIVPGGDASSSFPTTLVKNTHHNNAPTNDQLNTALFATTTTGNTNSEQIDFGSLNCAGHFGAAAAAPFNPHHASAGPPGHWGRPGVPPIQDFAGTLHGDTVGNDGETTFFDAEEDLSFVERIISDDESPHPSPIGIDASGGNEVTPPIDASTYAKPMMRIASGGGRPMSLTYPPGLYPNYHGDAITSAAHVAPHPTGAAPINTSGYRTPVVASKEALYAIGHWLASHIVGRLVHVNAALGSDSDVVATSGNKRTSWPLPSTMRSPALSRRSYPTDPYGVLNTHGYTSGTFKPHRDFAMFVNHLIDAHDIPAEVLVCAVWYLDRLPVHDIDGERGIRFRQLLCNIPPQETFGIERRLLFITLLLAGIAVTDEPCFTPPWSEATGVPKVDGAQLKTEAIMCLHQRGSIALRPETWLNHCTAVYSGLSKMTLDHQMGWLLLDVCHRMSANARECVDVDNATRARHSATMDALNMGGNAAAIHALRAYVDVSQMPSPVHIAPEAFPDAPAVAPMIVDVTEDSTVRKGKDVYAPFDGAPEFPDPFFEDDDDDDSLPPPPPCPSRRASTPQQVVAAKQDATGPNGDDDQSSCSDEQFLEYDGAVPFPGPRMFKTHGGSTTPPLERRNSLLSNGTMGSSGPTTPVLERVRSWRASLEVPVAADPTGPSIASRFRSVPMVPLSSGNGSSFNGSQWRVVSGASGDAPFADDFLAPFTPEKKAKAPHHPYQYHTVTGARPSRFSSNVGFGFFAKR